MDLRAQAAGALRFNLGREEFGFDKFAAQVKGRIDQDTLAAEFSAPKVEVTPAKASGTDVKASILLKGPQQKRECEAPHLIGRGVGDRADDPESPDRS